MKIRAVVTGAACAVAVAATSPHAIAHGRPAAVLDILAADEQGPRVVALSEGLAIAVDSEWHFVCPAEFGGTLPPPALSADGARTYVVGPNDLFALEPDGRVVALHRRDLSRETVLSLATTEGRLFATRYLYGRTELWRVDDGSETPIWQDTGVYSPLSTDRSGIWLVTQAGSAARVLQLSVDGVVLIERSFTMNPSSSIVTLLAASAGLYVTVVTSTLGSELLLVDGSDAGVSTLMTTEAPISGPALDGRGGVWFASSERLYAVSGATVRLTESAGRFSGVGNYGATSYASLHTRLVELGSAGPGFVLFDLAHLRPPLADAAPDARDDCNTQWLVFQGDLARAGLPTDGGSETGAGVSTAHPSPVVDASGGCALAAARHGSNGSAPSALALLLVSVACGARRRGVR